MEEGGGGGRPNKGVLRVQKMENLNRCLMFLSTKVGGWEWGSWRRGGGGERGRPNKGALRVQKMENLNRCLMFLSTKVGGV